MNSFAYIEDRFVEYPAFIASIFTMGKNVPVNAEGLNERQQWFMERLSAGRKVKAADIEARWNVVEKTAKRDIAELRKLELLEFVGAAKTGSYRLKTAGKG